jgi:hypothetical protein
MVFYIHDKKDELNFCRIMQEFIFLDLLFSSLSEGQCIANRVFLIAETKGMPKVFGKCHFSWLCSFEIAAGFI